MDLKGKEIIPEERKIIIKLRNEGKTLREIGKIVGRTHSRVIYNYTSSKSIISKARSGRPSRLTAREKRYVFKSSGGSIGFRDSWGPTMGRGEVLGPGIQIDALSHVTWGCIPDDSSPPAGDLVRPGAQQQRWHFSRINRTVVVSGGFGMLCVYMRAVF
ncbi:hypothetical protein CEXT_313081 [Caerostris extrusa]|uniref:Transposase IS30-like HTH domain-containing protein n=1 Tax=Caerostris extrusa TaxID=172846 RepID=A0AAV4MAD9_CAEEX|nr:hypothetical protein CEXT_313081 [Caerostris extrusa]